MENKKELFLSTLKLEFEENWTKLTKRDIEFAEYGFDIGSLVD